MGNIKKVPLRKCIGCNEMKNKKEMMRVLKTPEGEIVLDVTGRKRSRRISLFLKGMSAESHQEQRAGTFPEDADSSGGL